MHPLAAAHAAWRRHRLRLPPDPSPLPDSAALVPLPFAKDERIAVFRHDLYISPWIAAGRIWEPGETALLESLLPRCRWFVDGGANLGWFSLLAALRLPRRAPILAVEPEPANLRLLRHTFAAPAFRRITLLPVAFSDRPGIARLHLAGCNRGDHRLLDAPPDAAGMIDVRTETLDRLLAGALRGPGLVKLDIQGSEIHALHGARRLLADRRLDPALLVELWPATLARRAGDWRLLFPALGPLARLRLLDPEGRLHPPTHATTIMAGVDAAWAAAGHDPEWYCSLLACRPDSVFA